MKQAAQFDTMSFRIFVILLVGIFLAAVLGVGLADARRVADLRRLQVAGHAERVSNLLARMQAAPPSERGAMLDSRGLFIEAVNSYSGPGKYDHELTRMLRKSLPAGVVVIADAVPQATCRIIGQGRHNRFASHNPIGSALEAVGCWHITGRFSDGRAFSYLTGTPPFLLKGSRLLDPAFLIVLFLTAAMLAALVARMAAAPIRALARAAAELGPDLDNPKVREAGPVDVRAAIHAFNTMRDRLGLFMRERTYVLGAIAHDLQTPLTRLRLKLDQMPDGAQRQALLSDWQAMRSIVDEGLKLARLAATQEPAVLLNVDSMLASIADDEIDAGRDVHFESGAGVDCMCRPQMLRRCVQNLIDNAIRYGGSARLSTEADGHQLRIHVRDFGPGIPEALLERAFEPMMRLEGAGSDTGSGSGLGLTIARLLAQRNGADVHLRNADDGGLVATVSIPCKGR